MISLVVLVVVEMMVVEMMMACRNRPFGRVVWKIALILSIKFKTYGPGWTNPILTCVFAVMYVMMILTAAGPKCAPLLPAVHPGRTFATTSPSAKGLLKKPMTWVQYNSRPLLYHYSGTTRPLLQPLKIYTVLIYL